MVTKQNKKPQKKGRDEKDLAAYSGKMSRKIYNELRIKAINEGMKFYEAMEEAAALYAKM